MKRLIATIISILLFQNLLIAANNPTPLQIFFIIKKVFPETQEVNLFIPNAVIADEQSKITRAAAQTQLKAKIFGIENATDIGKSLKKLEEGSILFILNSDIIQRKSTKLYILSKCKENKIALITSSSEYSNSGALIGIFKDENQKTQIVLNLKHYDYFKSKFTDDFIQQAGIASVLK